MVVEIVHGVEMQSSLALSLGLPAVLVIIMLGLGMSLKLSDFRSVVEQPRTVLIGLFCQIVILPVLCFGLAYASNLPPAIAVGMMLLAASPGGTSGAVFTHLARGDVALSIALTAVTSALSIVTVPVIANIALTQFYGESAVVYLEFVQVAQIFVIAVVPALIGVFIQSRYPEVARRLERPVKILAMLFLVAVVLFALVGQWRLVATWGGTVGVVVLAFNLISFAVGYFVPRLLRVGQKQAIALMMSIGVHNAALVIAIALSEQMLGNPEMAIPPAGYALIAYVTGGLLALMLSRRRDAAA
jgi:BASS family bile acid:Na+ symporter